MEVGMSPNSLSRISRRVLISGCFLGAISLSIGTALAQDDSLARIQAAGKVKIGFANINPYGYVGPDGKITGQSPELTKAFFADMGIADIEPVITDFGTLIGGLVAQRFDIVSTGMLIQPERCKIVAFGNPEYQMNRAFAVRAGNPKGLTSFVALAKNPAAKLGMLTGAGELHLAELVGIPKDRQVLFPDLSAAVAGLQADRVDAVVASTVTIRQALARANDAQLEFATLTEQPADETGKPVVGYGGMAFRKEDKALREAWNAWLAENLKTGRVAKIIEPFGFGAETLPPEGITADDACAEK
jgi:polar amino acid transport system substrate-binding protein